MVGQALEHVAQVRFDVQAAQLRGTEQTVDRCGAFSVSTVQRDNA
jgi:hypothetical protein